MRKNVTKLILLIGLCAVSNGLLALSSGDVSVRLISGYFWLDNSCTAGGPQGKVVSFRVVNTKGSLLRNVQVNLGSIAFTAVPGTSYTGGTPSFTCRTSSSYYLGDIAAGDSATAFFFVGYNCLTYPNNTNITTDFITLPVTISDNLSGTLSPSFTKKIYVIRNANNNTITVLATSTNTVGTLTTISIAYSISNVKPSNIIDMELSTLSTFPAGYEIMGCKITASSITPDFPVNMLNTHYSNSISANLPSGGTVTIEWYLKVTGTSTGINSSNIAPFVVSDAGSAQRWQANTTSFTGTSVPVNPITLTKRVDNQHVLGDDTVRYTIVVRNSSTTADVTIDKLIDKLPRDYQFRYIETNTGIFPRLVTYSNSTAYPPFQDTNYLNFIGQKPLGGGVFSWVVPRNDSIKLIYSCKVSSNPGLNDTNFIAAYVGNSVVANAFAKVNVYAFLPVKLIHFAAQSQVNCIRVSWAVSDPGQGSEFILSRLNAWTGEYDYLKSITHLSETSYQDFSFKDFRVHEGEYTNTYQLVIREPNGQELTYITHVDESIQEQAFKVYFSNQSLLIFGQESGIKHIEVDVYDVLGRTISSDLINYTNGTAALAMDKNKLSGQYVFIKITAQGRVYTQRLFVE